MASSSRATQRQEHEMVGPRSFEEMMRWPDEYVNRMLESPRMREVFTSCAGQGQVTVFSDYSGKGCAEMTMELLKNALVNAGALAHETASTWKTWRASER